MRVYRFIDEQKADFDVKTLCRVCEVPRSSYYDWADAHAGGPNEATWAEALLAGQIHEIWSASRGRYGAPRVTAELWRQGVKANHKRVESLMAELGLQGICGRRKVRTTRRDPSAQPAADLVKRNFQVSDLDQLHVGDITYIDTDEGHCFLATVMDACSRRILGWSIASHLRTELCLDALAAAAHTRGKQTMSGVIFHSDHGCQYTSRDYNEKCTELRVTQSMGSVGDSYDNAMAESLFASLKRELVDVSHFTTIADARLLVFEWIVWYNRVRLHSSLGYLPPEEFEVLRREQEAA
ncbi:MAG: IS3 family transposase [Acidimicrobiales bacterium]